MGICGEIVVTPTSEQVERLSVKAFAHLWEKMNGFRFDTDSDWEIRQRQTVNFLRELERQNDRA